MMIMSSKQRACGTRTGLWSWPSDVLDDFCAERRPLSYEKQHFYGPLQRKMGGLGFIRLGVWQNFIRAWRSGYQGNMHGEGFILGGVFVIGAGDQGILLEHREKEFGNKVDTAEVLEAVKKIVPVK
ncbi:hypothetical protein CesoFtcFv8_021036 [Champsocephalus esox]|uniref:Peroxiredoxin-like 2A n=1 Tax=Champsocephalus esox TaxID=159716 RepID=A0AAN8BDD2_9TELE|nr:hypothetical protein CesoFtcFv8_021036 [Champsocephalus esox]